MAVLETCPINFMIKYGVAKIKLKNVSIGHADTLFGGFASAGICVPVAAAENISLNRAVDGSTLLKPIKYNNLKKNKNKISNWKCTKLPMNLLSIKPSNASYKCECGPKLCENTTKLSNISGNAKYSTK